MGFTLTKLHVKAETVIATQLDERHAFEQYDRINSTDISLGKLALERGTHQSVLHLGAMITSDHTGIRQEARNIANHHHLKVIYSL